MVNFVRTHEIFENPITAAIGDGSNDISMLLGVDISFGIQAPETKICSSISDFSITKFEDCRRLMLWHGRSFAFKATNLLIWSVFKNMLFCVPLIFFNSFTGYSSGDLVEGPQFLVYNIVTIIALFAYLFLDQDVSATQTEGHYDDHKFSLGKLYRYYNDYWNNDRKGRYIAWLIATFFAAGAVFFVPWIGLNGLNNPFVDTDMIAGGIINDKGFTGDFA